MIALPAHFGPRATGGLNPHCPSLGMVGLSSVVTIAFDTCLLLRPVCDR